MTDQRIKALCSLSTPITAIDAAGDVWVINASDSDGFKARCTVRNLPACLPRYGFKSMDRFFVVNPDIVRIESVQTAIATLKEESNEAR